MAGVLGFLIAPLIAAVILAALTVLSTRKELFAMVLLIPIFYWGAAIATGLLGVPVFLLLLRFGLVRWWTVLLGGLGIGAAAGLPFTGLEPSGFVLMAAAGGAASLVFWRMWKTGR